MIFKNRLRSNVVNIISFLLIALFYNGCVGIGTLVTFKDPQLYSAIRYDFTTCGKGGFQGVACTFFNMPVDLVLDTILLPYKTYRLFDNYGSKLNVVK